MNAHAAVDAPTDELLFTTDGAGIARIDAPARKGDLARMGAQVAGAQREEHRGLRFAMDDRHQHRRRTLLHVQENVGCIGT